MSEVCGIFSNANVLSTSEKQTVAATIAYIVLRVTLDALNNNWKGGFSCLVLAILCFVLMGTIISPSGLTLFKLYIFYLCASVIFFPTVCLHGFNTRMMVAL